MKFFMSFLRKYMVAICIIAAIILLLVSFASYLFASLDERTMLAQASCALAVAAIIFCLYNLNGHGDEQKK